MKVIGLCGLISSGKDTAADFLVNNYGFRKESFAGNLKDIVSIVFSWERDLLEGSTKESRAWREIKDEWWSARLNMEITPRWVLQYWGTDVLRNNFHDEIWIASLQRKLNLKGGNIVITDCRFPNEINILTLLGAKVCRIVRGADPEWFQYAKKYMAGDNTVENKAKLSAYKVHPSEYSWANTDFYSIIDNNGSLENLQKQLAELVDKA